MSRYAEGTVKKYCVTVLVVSASKSPPVMPDRFHELRGRKRRAAAEHHVFGRMSEARNPLFVGADLVVDHCGRDRRERVTHDDQRETVAQRGARNVEGLAASGRSDCAAAQSKTATAAGSERCTILMRTSPVPACSAASRASHAIPRVPAASVRVVCDDVFGRELRRAINVDVAQKIAQPNVGSARIAACRRAGRDRAAASPHRRS